MQLYTVYRYRCSFYSRIIPETKQTKKRHDVSETAVKVDDARTRFRCDNAVAASLGLYKTFIHVYNVQEKSTQAEMRLQLSFFGRITSFRVTHHDVTVALCFQFSGVRLRSFGRLCRLARPKPI